MQLEEFNTLQDAKNYIAPKERMISQDMIVSFLAKNNCVTSLQASLDEKAKGFYLAILSGVEEFNLKNSSESVGKPQQILLSYLVSINAVNQAFADDCILYANTIYKPFGNATKHDFELAKGTITRKAVTQTDGILTINTNTDCEAHNPQVYQYIESADFYKRVAGFRGVSVASKYQIEVPRVASLYIDDAYGVV